MTSFMHFVLPIAVLTPLFGALFAGLLVLLRKDKMSEPTVVRITGTAMGIGLIASLFVLAEFLGLAGEPVRGEISYGYWLRLGDFVLPAVFLLDGVSISISIFAGSLTLLIALFSRTYLHKEPGFVRFFILMSAFATGIQLVALAGTLEVLFAGWEIIGLASAFFIGYFHERPEPVRSAIRAFATYRLSDAGLLIAIVAVFDVLGSARFSALEGAVSLPTSTSTAIALLFIISAMGKSAQLPFSGWLPRAMEGPTPTSALFYGAVSIHAGLILLLRIWPMLEVSVVARTVGVVVGIATAFYATICARVHTDAKGAIAHATLAQVGLILAEICMGWTTFAMVHMIGHAFLRLGQYLKAPNTIHDIHRLGHAHHHPTYLERKWPGLAARLYAAGTHRFRLDERVDAALAPFLALARLLDRIDRGWRDATSLDKDPIEASAIRQLNP